MKLGCHVAMKEPDMLLGSVKEGILFGADCIMIYTGPPQNTIRKDISLLKIEEALALSDNEIIVHAPYITNLANVDKRAFGVSFLIEEVKRAYRIGAKQMVLHPGSAVNSSREEAISSIAEGINQIIEETVLEPVKIALETMSGKGNEVGKTFEEIKSIIDKVEDKSRISVCIDTCHLHDGGYDIVNDYEGVIREFDDIVGIDKISVIHINDSKNVINSHKDRHANIGTGYIGEETLKKFVHDIRFIQIPKILETPYINDKPPYKEEIERLRKAI